MLCWGAVLEGAASLLSLSGSFSCPLHCHPSTVLPFISGICIGFLFGLCTGLWLFWVFVRPFLVPPAVPERGPPPERPPAPHLQRLRAYLHE